MKQWIVDAGDIGEISEGDLVITPSIKKFIAPGARDNMYFVVAPKGMGKTLTLRYKSQLMHRRGWDREDMYFIPRENLVDKNIAHISFSREKIDILRDNENWENIWSLCISLSVLKNLKTTYERRDDEEKRDELDNWIQNLPDEIRKLIEDPLPSTPYDYLNEILELSPSGIIKVVEKQPRLAGVIRKVRSGVAIFIDNADECFGEHQRIPSDTDSFSGELSLDIWYAAQIGLIRAIWAQSNFLVI